MLRDCSKKVSTTRANGNLDKILRFLDASSMMVSREKAWNFNDSLLLAVCDAECGISINRENPDSRGDIETLF
jgi:hypothetical protein